MAHMLELNEKGEASMAYAGETPWHGLGSLVADNLSPAEMTKAAGLDWKVEKKPIMVVGGKQIKGRFAIVRDKDGAPLGIGADKYTPFQNEEFLDFFTKFVHAGSMTMETAGSLDNGQRVWGMAKIKDGAFDVVKGDKIEGYLLMCNQHAPGRKAKILFTPTRVVCHNTLSYALDNAGANGTFAIAHTKEFDANMKEKAELALGISAEHMKTFKEASKFLASKSAKDIEVDRYFCELFQPDLDVSVSDDYNRTVEELRRVYSHQPGIEYAPNTWWQAFNAVTFFADHLNGNSKDLAKQQNNRLRAAWFGKMADKKHAALKAALQYAGR